MGVGGGDTEPAAGAVAGGVACPLSAASPAPPQAPIRAATDASAHSLAVRAGPAAVGSGSWCARCAVVMVGCLQKNRLRPQ